MADRASVVLRIMVEELGKMYRPSKSDCFMTGLKVADAIRQENVSGQYEGTYKNRAASDAFMKAKGFNSLADILDLHYSRKSAGFLNWGDLAVVNTEEGEHVAVCCGQVFAVKAPSGQLNLSIEDVVAGFGI